jgi:oligoendopeptidase F
VKELLESGLNLDNNTNNLAGYLQNVIVKSASRTFGIKKLRTTTSFPINTWYDDECKAMRKTLQNALRTNDPRAKQYHKQYKSLVRTKKAKYSLEQSEILCKQAKLDPAGFWKKIKGLKPHINNSITDEKWVEAFKSYLDLTSQTLG